MSAEDLQEMSRRLEKVRFVSERGYEPVFDEVLGEWMWIKCHYGSVHTRRHPGGDCPRREKGVLTQLQRLIITFKDEELVLAESRRRTTWPPRSPEKGGER